MRRRAESAYAMGDALALKKKRSGESPSENNVFAHPRSRQEKLSSRPIDLNHTVRDQPALPAASEAASAPTRTQERRRSEDLSREKETQEGDKLGRERQIFFVEDDYLENNVETSVPRKQVEALNFNDRAVASSRCQRRYGKSYSLDE